MNIRVVLSHLITNQSLFDGNCVIFTYHVHLKTKNDEIIERRGEYHRNESPGRLSDVSRLKNVL
jgi:hypothetical protein